MPKKNLTIALDDALIGAAKLQAQRLGLSLNEMIRDFLGKSIRSDIDSQTEQEFFEILEATSRSSKKAKWSRGDAYES